MVFSLVTQMYDIRKIQLLILYSIENSEQKIHPLLGQNIGGGYAQRLGKPLFP